MFRQDLPLEIENFLSPNDCELLISYYKDNLKIKSKYYEKTGPDSFWNNRTVPLDDIVYNNIRTMVEDLHYMVYLEVESS